jgi:hypothetical protein
MGLRWLSYEAIGAKRQRRRLERYWKKTRDNADRIAYRAACSEANKLINASRNQHHRRQLNEVAGNPRRTWATVKDLLHSTRSTDSNPVMECPAFGESLSAFFINKIQNLKAAITTVLAGNTLDPLGNDLRHNGPQMSKLGPVSVDEVSSLLRSMLTKSSPLDFVPTSLLKSCSAAFSLIIARLANLSFEQSMFPDRFKAAMVTPLLKKEGIDASDPANYRPISNLNTISKILERLFLARLTPHVRSTTSFNPLQSAYRCMHSTETALNKIMHDTYEAFDSGRATILVALDLSAAFDTIDHNTLVGRLHHTFGVSGAALDWLRSYLGNRRSCMRWGTRCTS